MAFTNTPIRAGSGATVRMMENYIYISHLDEGLQYWFIPSSPDTINDSMTCSFTATNALGRSAPVQTYNSSGPRTVQFTVKLHRDLMDDINLGVSNAKLGIGEDYVENLIRAIQAIAVPKYNVSNKAVEPPLVAVRIAKQIFIKGVVTDVGGVTYEKPILESDKYSQVTISFTVTEIDPYDASEVYKNGSYRGMVRTLSQGALQNLGISEE